MNAVVSRNTTPLILVLRNHLGGYISKDCDKVIHSLIAKGADVNIRDSEGRSATDYATYLRIAL